MDEIDALSDAIVEDTIHGAVCDHCGAVGQVYVGDLAEGWEPGDCLDGERELCADGRARLRRLLATDTYRLPHPPEDRAL